MLKKIALILVSLLPFANHAEEFEQVGFPQFAYESPSELLLDSSYRYLDLIDQISNGLIPDDDYTASILSPHCKKIFNGNLVTLNRDEFIIDLITTYELQGRWIFFPEDVIAATLDCVIMRLTIVMQDSGVFTSMVILAFDECGLIFEINEVLTKMN